MITFTVHGEPVGKGRPKFARRGSFVTAYTPEKTANYENLVKLYASQVMAGKELLECPVSVTMWINVGIPASFSKKKAEQAVKGELCPTKKPDIDNIVKGIFDALNDVVWKDDKQVCHLSVVKKYSATPCLIMGIEKHE